MSWIIVGIGAGVGAIAGASSKKHAKGDERWKRALTGAAIGGSLGAGGAALGIGGAAGGAGATGTLTGAGTTLGGTGAIGGSAGLGAGTGVAGTSLGTSMGGSAALGTGAASAPIGGTSSGFLSQFMRNDPNGNQFMQKGKGMLQDQMLSGIMGGGQQNQQAQQQAAQIAPYESFQGQTAPMTQPISPYAREEMYRRYMMGLAQ